MAGETSSNLRPATWDDVIRHEAKQARVPPELALAIAETESNFDPTATSPKGARGIFQLMPATAAELGVDPNDPVQNIRGGLAYFRKQLDAHGGDVQKALQAYNWGPGNVAKGGQPPAETQQYVSRIISRLPKPVEPLPVVSVQQMNRQIAQPPPGTPIGQTAGGPSVFDKGLVGTMVESFDPTTPTGRRNLAGGLGAAAGTAAVVGTAPVTAPVLGLGAAAAGVLGATGGGFLAESGEQIVGTKPPSGSAVLGAGAEQGVLETVGQAVGAGVKGLAKRAAGTVVGQKAVTAFKELLSQKPSTEAAGEAAYAVIRRGSRDAAEGPAHLAKSAIGERVEQAALNGPDVDWTPVKAELGRMAQQIQPGAELPIGPGSRALLSPEQLAQLQAAGHPLPGLLGELQQLPDTIPFADAHRYKRLLDDAINWESPAKKQIQGITEKTRTTLRNAMSGYEPYDAATKEYEQIAPLFYKGHVPKLQKAAIAAPESLVDMIRGDRPKQFRMLHEVLTTRAAEGGGAEQGVEAWHQVLRAWTNKKLVRGPGGLAGLDARLDKMDNEFVETFTKTAHGQQILHNLKSIAAAFKASTFATPDVEADVARAVFAPGTRWGTISLMRLLRGPKSADLIQWAAYEPKRTQMLVRAMTGPEAGLIAADLVRMLPEAILGKGALEEATGTPPPKEKSKPRVGAPPP